MAEKEVTQHGMKFFIKYPVFCPECNSSDFYIQGIRLRIPKKSIYQFACRTCRCEWQQDIVEEK